MSEDTKTLEAKKEVAGGAVVKTENPLKKFMSRKFLMSLAGMIIGICGMFAVPDNTAATIAFVALEVISLVAYIVTEGAVDAKSVESTIKVSEEVIELVNSLKEGREAKIDTTKGVQDELLNEIEKKVGNN